MTGAGWKEYWQSSEESFLERQIQNYKAKWGYLRLLNAIPECTKTGKVLEVGAGKAWISRLLRRTGWHTTAIDSDADIVKNNSQHVDRYIVGDMLKIPFDDKSFDLVISCGLVEHFTEDIVDKIIAEMRRVGRSVVVWFPTCSWEWRIWWGIRNMLGGNVYTKSYQMSITSVAQIFGENGLRNIRSGVIVFGGIFRFVYVYGVE